MDKPDDLSRPPSLISDWLELGDRLGPDRRQGLLALFERQESQLGANRETLRRAEEMLAEGAVLLDKMRTLRVQAEAGDRGRLDAVIHTIEQTQRLIASHYARLGREWLHSVSPLEPGPEDPSEP